MTHGKPVSEWVSISAYAVQYGVTRPTVRKWLAAGLVLSYRVGRVVRVQNQPPAGRPPRSAGAR